MIADAADGVSALDSLVQPVLVVVAIVAVFSLLIAGNTSAFIKKSSKEQPPSVDAARDDRDA
jgi:hypothetical protein